MVSFMSASCGFIAMVNLLEDGRLYGRWGDLSMDLTVELLAMLDDKNDRSEFIMSGIILRPTRPDKPSLSQSYIYSQFKARTDVYE